MTTHAIIYRDGKRWFTQHHTGHPDYTGKLLLSLWRKYGKITPLHVKRYFDPCQQPSSEYEYDIRKDGIYWRTSPTCMTLFMKKPTKAEIKSAQREHGWRKLTAHFTGALGDIDKFLHENVQLTLKKDNPRAEKSLKIPLSKFPIGTEFYQSYDTQWVGKGKKGKFVTTPTHPGKVTRKHYDGENMGWHYDVGDLCYSEKQVEENLIHVPGRDVDETKVV